MNLKKEIEAFCDEKNVCFSGRHFGDALDNCTQPVVISCKRRSFKYFFWWVGADFKMCVRGNNVLLHYAQVTLDVSLE